MRRSRSPASSCCTAFGRDSSNCHLSAFKVELHLQSGTRCFRPELCAAKQECLLVLAICTRAVASCPRLHANIGAWNPLVPETIWSIWGITAPTSGEDEPPADGLIYRQRPAAIGVGITLLGGRRGEFACGTIAVDDSVVGGARHATGD